MYLCRSRYFTVRERCVANSGCRATEMVFEKRLVNNTHFGAFGLVNGLFFQESALMWLGMVVAILYGVIDKWLYKRQSKGKSLKMFVLMPIAFIFLSWLFLQWISPPQPPFTKEDAITTATAGMENLINYFPKEVGSLEETIDGYKVVRETSVKE